MLWLILGGGIPALIVGLLGVGCTMVVTQRTHNGTIQERRRKRSRWAARRRLGTDRFVPFTLAGWDQIQAAAKSADKRERRRAEVAARRMRANPDGSDGMGWLQHGIAELFGASGFFAVLTKLRWDGSVDDTIARRIQTRLDVEELRLVGADDMG